MGLDLLAGPLPPGADRLRASAAGQARRRCHGAVARRRGRTLVTPYEEAERPPRAGWGGVKRGLLAMFLVMAMSATALATTVVLEVDDVKNVFLGPGRQQIDIPEIT